MTRRLVKRVAAPPPRYVPSPPRYEPPPPPKRRNKVRAARVTVFEDGHAELTMLGFERVDLDLLKASVSMRWDNADKVWIVHRSDVRYLLEALEDGEFIVRLRHAAEQ